MAVEDIFHQEWTPSIGDPTFVGWFTVVAYAITAILALGRRRADREDELCCSGIWMLLALLLFLLAINKQLDLQSWFTQTLKEHAIVNGWYHNRREYQSLFIVMLGIVSVIFLGFLLFIVRERWQDFSIAAIGLAFLLAFVLARASSFHHVDLLINHTIAGIRLNWIFELGGIILIAIGTRYRYSTIEPPTFESTYPASFH